MSPASSRRSHPRSRTALFAGMGLLLVLIDVLALEFAVWTLDIASPSRHDHFKYVKHALYNPFLIFGPHVGETFEQEEGKTCALQLTRVSPGGAVPPSVCRSLHPSGGVEWHG